ncbi:DUF159-domain-containing protein [Auricularia subglabra TFB-10046 SS5]|nr:DUF159-domain-containing protein [Auricularia subglabra TFB-10046 SS5]
MCGRFALNRAHLAANVDYAYNGEPEEWVDQDNFQPRNNIAPRSNAPVLRRARSPPSSSDSASDSAWKDQPSRLILQTMRWGVVPHWTRFDAPNSELKTINARGENLLDAQTGLWNSLKKHKRCVVPADGYFEWLAKAPGVKLPHFVRHKDKARCLMMAGLWDVVKLDDGKGEELWTFAVVTVAANKQLGWLHDRMPLILYRQQDVETWLNGDLGWSKEVIALVKPYDGPDLECYQVPNEVGKVGTDSPSYVLPISQRKDGILASFSRQKKASAKAPPSSPLHTGDVLVTQNSDEPPQAEVIDISDSSQPQPSSSSQPSTRAREVIEIPSSPPLEAQTHDPDVIEILSSPPPAQSTSSAKRKRDALDDTVDLQSTPTKKRPKPTAKMSPRKKVVEAGKEKGNGKITNFFGRA